MGNLVRVAWLNVLKEDAIFSVLLVQAIAPELRAIVQLQHVLISGGSSGGPRLARILQLTEFFSFSEIEVPQVLP